MKVSNLLIYFKKYSGIIMILAVQFGKISEDITFPIPIFMGFLLV